MTAHRVRSALSIALLWAIAWGACGALLALDRSFNNTPLASGSRHAFQYMAFTSLLFGTCGLLAGTAFAAALARAERSKTFESLSSLRIACWGLLGGALAGLTAFRLFGATSLSALALGAGAVGALASLFAVGTLRLARSARATRPAASTPRSAISH